MVGWCAWKWSPTRQVVLGCEKVSTLVVETGCLEYVVHSCMQRGDNSDWGMSVATESPDSDHRMGSTVVLIWIRPWPVGGWLEVGSGLRAKVAEA